MAIFRPFSVRKAKYTKFILNSNWRNDPCTKCKSSEYNLLLSVLSTHQSRYTRENWRFQLDYHLTDGKLYSQYVLVILHCFNNLAWTEWGRIVFTCYLGLYWVQQQGKSRNRWTFDQIENLRYLHRGLWGLQLHIWFQIKGLINIFHFRGHATKLKCVEYSKTWFLPKTAWKCTYL